MAEPGNSAREPDLSPTLASGAAVSAERARSDRVERVRQRLRRLDTDLREARRELLRSAGELAEVTRRYQGACCKAHRLRDMVDESEARVRRASSEIRRLCAEARNVGRRAES